MKHKMTLQQEAHTLHLSYLPKRSIFKTWVDTGLKDVINSTEVCLRIVDKQEIQQLNHTYRQQNKPTNVLSFPSELPELVTQKIHYLGDIILCADIIETEALEQKKTLPAHWAHMVLHGLLHLRGYDHTQEKDAVIMETLEIQLLAKLGFNNPYERYTDE